MIIPKSALEHHLAFGKADPTIVPTDADRAYAAGFFDGEGSITIAMDRRRDTARGPIFNMRVGASQNDVRPLFWLRDRWGGSVNPMSRRTVRSNVTYAWWCFARMAAAFLMDVRPFLQVKADRADIAIAFQSERYNPGVRGLTIKDRDRMLSLREQLAALNQHKPLARGVAQ